MDKTPEITKEEFEIAYCKGREMSRTEYAELFTTMPCFCDYPLCRGWAAIRNDPDMIEQHLQLYSTPSKETE